MAPYSESLTNCRCKMATAFVRHTLLLFQKCPQSIHPFQLTSLLLINVTACDTITCVVSNKPRLPLASFQP